MALKWQDSIEERQDGLGKHKISPSGKHVIQTPSGKHDLANDLEKEIVSGSSRKRGNSFSEFSKTRLDQAADLFRGWCWSYVEGQHPDLPIISLTNH